jgi:hypothetical protein
MLGARSDIDCWTTPLARRTLRVSPRRTGLKCIYLTSRSRLISRHEKLVTLACGRTIAITVRRDEIPMIALCAHRWS